MGCDGGTIPRRDELVRTKKKPEQVDKNAENVAKWKHCAISQDPLRKPIVSCELGRLYNKEAVIKHLLNKDVACEVATHINKLSDVKELNLTEKNGYKVKSDQKGDEYVDFHDSRFICPVTGLDMNGTQRFYFLWKCGCVVSERAVKEVKSETCHKCGAAYNKVDFIIINGTDEEIAILKEKMQERRRLAKLEKRKKKASTVNGLEEKKIKVEPEELAMKLPMGPPVKKVKIEPGTSKDSFKNGSLTKSGTNGSKVEESSNSKAQAIQLPEKAKKSYSIAKDPTASAAFKSLFTTHKTAKNQEKAHWVTHNPCYF